MIRNADIYVLLSWIAAAGILGGLFVLSWWRVRRHERRLADASRRRGKSE